MTAVRPPAPRGVGVGRLYRTYRTPRAAHLGARREVLTWRRVAIAGTPHGLGEWYGILPGVHEPTHARIDADRMLTFHMDPAEPKPSGS